MSTGNLGSIHTWDKMGLIQLTHGLCNFKQKSGFATFVARSVWLLEERLLSYFPGYDWIYQRIRFPWDDRPWSSTSLFQQSATTLGLFFVKWSVTTDTSTLLPVESSADQKSIQTITSGLVVWILSSGALPSGSEVLLTTQHLPETMLWWPASGHSLVSPSQTCETATPMPSNEGCVERINGWLKSGLANTTEFKRAGLSFWKDRIHSVVQSF